MTLRNQIEARTNAANTSAVWKHLKLSERETQKSLQARNTDNNNDNNNYPTTAVLIHLL